MTQTFPGSPVITTHPVNHLVTVNMSVTLNCEGFGGRSPSFHWQTNNGGTWMQISNNNGKSLVVSNLEQSQQYRCVMSNELGTTRSNIATITVLSK